VRAFFGLASYYRRYVRNFASIAEPLTRLTKINTPFKWTDDADFAFSRLKQALLESTTLTFPVPGLPCILDTDASDLAIGAVLSQVVDGVERPIAFYSCIMNSAQRNYCPTRRELERELSLRLCNTFDTTYSAHIVSNGYALLNVQKGYLPDGSRRYLSSTMNHKPGRLHCNADGVSRPIGKQCWGKNFTTPCIDEFERAELIAPLGVHTLTVPSELTTKDISELQIEDPVISPLLNF